MTFLFDFLFDLLLSTARPLTLSHSQGIFVQYRIASSYLSSNRPFLERILNVTYDHIEPEIEKSLLEFVALVQYLFIGQITE